MKIICATCMYKRPNVSEIFLEGMKRLGIPVVAAVSESESDKLCEDNGVDTIAQVNEPLGNKWNGVVTYAYYAYDWTHILISGDDNLYSDRCLELWEQNKTANFQGLSSLYFIKPSTMEALEMRYDLEPPIAIGTGRLLSRVAIMKMTDELGNIKLFNPNQNRELDHVQDLMLLEKGFYPTIIDRKEPPLCVDIKTEQNIWSFDNFLNNSNQVDYQKAISFLSEKEREMLLYLNDAKI